MKDVSEQTPFDNPLPAPRRDLIFRGFVMGVITGGIIGLIIHGGQGNLGKAYREVYVGVWGLIGGMCGLLVGVLHRIMRRK